MHIKIPILTYHSLKVLGNSYETNDHVALYHDLRTIQAQGFRIVPLMWTVEWILEHREESALERSVALSFDDGSDFDYYDLDHLHHGWQRSFYNILRDFRQEYGLGAQPYLHGSCFVIVSPVARQEIGTYAGRNWMTDDWWSEANNSGIMNIYSHSWDHNHPAVSVVCEKNQQRGSFRTIDSYQECQAEVQQAAEYVHQKISPAWPDLFAYPWGQSSDYIREVYFPRCQGQHRMKAAFGASGGYLTKRSARWDLPRFVCAAPWPTGWSTPDELVKILQGAQSIDV